MNVAEKLQALLTASNATTGESDTTLTDAVQSLIDGYGGGGVMPAPPGCELLVNEFDITLSSDSNPPVQVEHGLSSMPAYIVCSVKNFDEILSVEKNILVSGVWSGAGEFIPELGIVAGGHYKRSNERAVRVEAGNFPYYINGVNESTFNFGYDAAGRYSWPGGYEIHVACFGFKKVVV